MKILILSNITSYTYRFRKEILTALIEKGWQVTVSAANDGLLEELQAIGVKFMESPVDRHGTNLSKDFTLLRRYYTIMQELRPNVVFTYTIKPNIYGNLAAKSLGIPVISTVTGLGETFINGNIVSRLVKMLYRLAFRYAACIFFLNREDMDIMRNMQMLQGRARLLSSGSGVNLEEFPDMDYPAEGNVSFLYIGRVTRSKGIGELIAATRRMQAEYPDTFTVTIIGFHEGDVRQDVDQAVAEGIIHYPGFQKDVKLFMQDAHCVLLPSYREGVSISLLEAAASGRPLIATNVSGCREVVDDGVNGFLCKPRDSDSLYECMKRFLELTQEQRNEMGAASRRKVEAEFDRKRVVNTMLNIIEELIGGLI